MTLLKVYNLKKLDWDFSFLRDYNYVDKSTLPGRGERKLSSLEFPGASLFIKVFINMFDDIFLAYKMLIYTSHVDKIALPTKRLLSIIEVLKPSRMVSDT